MKKGKFVIQIINHENGNRSKPFEASWDELNATLTKAGESVSPENYILLVAAIKETDGDEQMHIPTAPLITIGTFMEMFQDEVKQLEEAE